MQYTQLQVIKVPFTLAKMIGINLDSNAKILRCEYNEDESEGCLWALVNPSNNTELTNFILVKTGEYIDVKENEQLVYCGTLNSHTKGHVRHLFKVVPFNNTRVCFER